MGAGVAAGTILSISAGLAATQDAAGYVALTYTAIGEVTDPGETGETWDIATHVPLADGKTQKFKGSRNAGAQTIRLALDTDDAGQVLAKAASLSTANYSFKQTMPNGDIYYMKGVVKSFVVSPGAAGAVVQATLSIERNYTGTTPHVEVLAA